jgi:hypothetical protein
VINATNLAGEQLNATNFEQQQGSLDFFFNPIPPEFFEVGPVSTPSVELFVNGMKAACKNPNPLQASAPCFFSYDNAQTLSVSDVNVVSGAVTDTLFSGAMVTLDGGNFGTNASLLQVTFGSAPCVITSVSAEQIACTLGAGTTGTYAAQVLHSQLGYAVVNASASSLTIGFRVDSIQTLTDSMMGGSIMVIAGEGFSATPSANNVSIGEGLCAIVAATPSRLACQVPAYTVNSKYAFVNSTHAASGTVSVAISIGIGSYQHGVDFVYDWGLTPTVLSASPSLVSAGRTTELVFGVSFASSLSAIVLANGASQAAIQLQVGSTDCLHPVLTDSSTATCTFPRGTVAPIDEQVPLPPVLSVANPAGGVFRAHVDPAVTVQFALRVTSIQPKLASLVGGTTITSMFVFDLSFSVWCGIESAYAYLCGVLCSHW